MASKNTFDLLREAREDAVAKQDFDLAMAIRTLEEKHKPSRVQDVAEPSDREKRLLALVRVVSDFVHPPAVPALVLEEWRRKWLDEARELGVSPE